MKMPPSDSPVKPIAPRRGRWLIVLAVFIALAWTLPRPQRHDVVVESADGELPAESRLAFLSAELLGELSGKGSLADETELSGPCFGLDIQTLFFARSRPGQRADIVRSTFDGEHWSKPEGVRELNSVDDDRRMTLSGDGVRAVFASNRSGGHGGFDLYEVANDGETWFRPRNIGTAINSDAEEFDPALTPDGLTLYFARGIPGSKADIFVARRESVEAKWSSPQPVNAINLPETHERSPTVSSDGQSLLFASNRGRRAGETGTFALFRTPIRDGVVGPVERLTDGIASDADDLDAAFAPDGLSIVFASKRDGAKQLFLSRGEFVVSQLAISTAHLDRFGPAKWGAPFVGLLLFVVAWRWSRKVRPASVAVVKVVAPKRSEPPKNPLKTWASTEPVAAQPAPAKVNPLFASAALPAATTEEKAPTKSESRHPTRRRVVVALLVVAASLVIAVRFDFWKGSQKPSDGPVMTDLKLLNVAGFADVATAHPIDLLKFDRFDTAKTAAPQPVAAPSDAVALRPAARWPNDRVVVRSRSEVARLADIEPPASKLTRLAVLARQPLPVELTRPTIRPAEEASVVSVAVAGEKPHVIAATITTKQDFVPPAAERTSVPPATASRASLLKPNARVEQFAPPLPGIPNGIDPSRSLARRGAVTRITEPNSLLEPQALAGLVAVTSTESPLPPQPVIVARVDAPPIGQSVPANSIAVRSLLPPSKTVPVIAGSTSDPSTSTVRLPMKSPTTFKVAPLIEEPALPAKDSASDSSSAPATLSPIRIETQGPLVAVPVVAPTSRSEVTMPRTVTRIDAVTATDAVARVAPNQPQSTPRPSGLPIISLVAAESTIGPMPGNPAILLTSATMLIELLAPPQLASLPRAESAGPTPSVSADAINGLARWFSRSTTPAALDGTSSAITLRSSSAIPILPRREQSLAPAEIQEDVK